MKDYTSQISQAQADKIINYFIDNDYSVEVAEGTLTDNYLVNVGTNNLKLGHVKIRKYIVIIGKYLNEWSSTLDLILTDNEKTFRDFCELLLN